MKIFPAIDILDGKVVRLTRGEYDSAKTYSDDPVAEARRMQEMGAKYLHVVDLNGARSGSTDNFRIISYIISSTRLKVEVGGGIRDMATAGRYLKAGAFRVILGTAAVKNYPFALAANEVYPRKIAIGVDAKDGKVAVSGWEEKTDTDSVAFCKKLVSDKLRDIIYTDVACDGNMSGTNFEIYRKLTKIKNLRVTASGGVHTMEELEKLRDIGVDGVILGKALYEGALDLRKGIGFFMTMISKPKVKTAGMIISGFGMIFAGLYLMSAAMNTISRMEEIKSLSRLPKNRYC